MAIKRIECPECGAGLKSPTGFEAGQNVECPKCETNFTVKEPAYEEVDPAAVKKPVKALASRAGDDEDEKPRKKKKRREDDDDDMDDRKKSYKNSPMRYAVLGVLVTIMLVLAVLLYFKYRGEKEEVKANEDPAPSGPIPAPPQGGPIAPGGPGFPGKGPIAGPGGKMPNFPPGKFPNNPPPINQGGGNSLSGLSGFGFGGSPASSTPEGKQLLASLSAKLVGTWEGTVPNGATDKVTHKVTYQAGGQYSHEVTGSAKSSASKGSWQVIGLVGSKGLKLNRGVNVPVTVVFEDDELLHDTGTPGETVVLRKK